MVRAFYEDDDESVSTLKYYRGGNVVSWGKATRNFEEYVFSSE